MRNVMPDKMKAIEWIDPWEPVGRLADGMNAELQKEVPPQHILHGRSAEAIGHRIDCDDVLFVLEDNTLAVVHLTWSGKQDQNPQFPWTVRYQTVGEFVEKAMLPDVREYRNEA